VSDGFRAAGTVRVPAVDHVGIREGFEDAAGRTVHATAGIAGEFGEGGRDAGTFAVSTGGTGTLYGDGSSWVLVWSVPGPCTPLTVGGSGFDRRGFLELLEATGVAHTLGE
jgi:hypothetical protein